MIKCPYCHEELRDLLLGQRSFDVVEVYIDKYGGVNYDIVDQGKADPDGEFTCPKCFEGIHDLDIEEQLKGGEKHD